MNAKAPLAWHDWTFYCGETADAACSVAQSTLMVWLLEHMNYLAQTAVASSYGLLQVMYPTAVGTMKWKQNCSPQDRDPVLLFDPNTSLDLGAGYDASNISSWGFHKNPSPSFGALLEYQKALVAGFLRYNPAHNQYQRGLHIQQGWHFRPF
jgi:hypothetical protein